MKATVRLQREPFDAAAEAATLTRGRSDFGAVVTFTGICRGDEDGQTIAALFHLWAQKVPENLDFRGWGLCSFKRWTFLKNNREKRVSLLRI